MLFWDLSTTCTCEFRCHRAGSQLKIKIQNSAFWVVKNTSKKTGILWLSASDCKILLMSTQWNVLAVQFCVQNYFNFQKKLNFINLAPRIPWWKIWAENLWRKVLGTIFKKNVIPAWASSNYLPPSAHVRIFPYLYSFTPIICVLGWGWNFFKIWNSVSIMPCHY